MRRLLLCMLGAAVVAVGGTALIRLLSMPGKPDLPRTAALVPLPRERPLDRSALARAVRTYLAGRPGRAGVMVTDLRTGLSYGAWESGRFVTASMIKVDILTALLLQRQHRNRALTRSERELAAEMIKVSDNSAASALYAEVGDGSGLSRANRVLGLRQTRPRPGIWGVSRTSPADQVRLLRTLTDPASPLSASNRRYVLELMSAVIGEQRWGISAAARPGERVAIKNGWVPLDDYGDGWAVNSMGRITGRDHDFLVAVCSQDQPTMESGVQTVEQLASLVVTRMRQAG